MRKTIYRPFILLSCHIIDTFSSAFSND